MNDRPLAPILAALAAVMFVAAFSAAAVMRPDSAADPAAAAARTAPATAQENASLATLVSPSLSRVAALPALHLPKARQAEKKSKPARSPRRRARRDGRAAGGHRRSARQPSRRARAAQAEVERRQDLRLQGMIRRQAHGHDRPSLRWVAAGLVVALIAAFGGWMVAEKIAADPATVPSVLEGAAGRARAAEGLDRLGRGAQPSGAARARGRAGLDAVLRAGHDRVGRAAGA